MLRRINPKKDPKKKNENPNEIPLKAKRREQKEKYRNQWLEDDDEEMDIDLFGEEEVGFEFDDELEIDYENIDFEKQFDDEDHEDSYDDEY